MNCLHCGATNSNGLALCALCQTFAKTILAALPVYFGNLVRWRPERAGSRPVAGSRPPRGTSTEASDRVSRAIDEAGTDLVGWAEVLDDDRPGVVRWPLDLADVTEGEQAVRLCGVFAEYVVSIATLEWCGEFVRKLAEHEAALRSLTETVVPGWYAGACRRCTAPTHVVPGFTWVTCGACGATTYARDHLDVVLEEARDWVARPMRLAEAAVALIDTEQSVARLYERIKKWEQRGKVAGVRKVDGDGDPVGPKRYRFGDVLDRLFAEGSTQSKTSDEVA